MNIDKFIQIYYGEPEIKHVFVRDDYKNEMVANLEHYLAVKDVRRALNELLYKGDDSN